MGEIIGITCRKCNRFLTEQPKPRIFVCRDCKLGYPMEHGSTSMIRPDYDLTVPIEDVIGSGPVV